MPITRSATPRQLLYAEGGRVLDDRYYNGASTGLVGGGTKDTPSSGLIKTPSVDDTLSGALSNLPDAYKASLDAQYKRAVMIQLQNQAIQKAKGKLSVGAQLLKKFTPEDKKEIGKYYGTYLKDYFGEENIKDGQVKSLNGKYISVGLGGRYYKYADPQKLGDSIVDTGQKGVMDSYEEYKWLHGDVKDKQDLYKKIQDRYTIENKKSTSFMKRIAKFIPAIAGMVMAPGIGAALSTGLGVSTATGTALAGAGFGAIGGAATGGGLKGALTGAALGGVGGYVKGAGGIGKAVGLDGSSISRLPDGTWVKAVDTGNAIASVEPNMLEKVMYNLSNSAGASGGGEWGSKLSTLSKAMNAYSSISGEQQVPQQQRYVPVANPYDLRKKAPSQSLISRYRDNKGYDDGGMVEESMMCTSLSSLAPRLIKGNGDGMSDDVPAVINGETPAALSDSEYVTPALQVALLGRGSPEAGSKRIEELIEKEIKKMYGKGIDPKSMQRKATSTR
jgi:hypothetical protein